MLNSFFSVFVNAVCCWMLFDVGLYVSYVYFVYDIIIIIIILFWQYFFVFFVCWYSVITCFMCHSAVTFVHLLRPCVVFLACVHLALFLALFLSPVNFLVSSWYDLSMLASLLWQCQQFPLYCSYVENPFICFLCCPWNTQNLSQSFHLKGLKMCFVILSECPAFTAVCDYRPH